jgi:hypothetical protein
VPGAGTTARSALTKLRIADAIARGIGARARHQPGIALDPDDLGARRASAARNCPARSTGPAAASWAIELQQLA